MQFEKYELNIPQDKDEQELEADLSLYICLLNLPPKENDTLIKKMVEYFTYVKSKSFKTGFNHGVRITKAKYNGQI